jgi:ATP-dependent DNA helicase RecG
MPSALETLVKILKLERAQGYKNSAVIGGITAYTETWKALAHAQAKKPEHHYLVDEIGERLQQYDDMANKNERHSAVAYILDRITGRVPPPEHLRVAAEQSSANTRQEPAPPTKQKRARAPEQQKDNESQVQNTPREKKKGKERGNSGQKPRENPAPRNVGNNPVRDRDEGGDDHNNLSYDYIGEARSPARRDLPLAARLERPPRRPRPKVEIEQALDTLRGLRASVEKIRNIGPQTAATLNKLAIQTINDLLFYLPRRYDDYTHLIPIARLQPNTPATIIGSVRSAEIRIAQGGRKDFQVVIDDGSAVMTINFFGQFYLQSKIRPQMQLVLRGIPSVFRNRLQLANPEWEELDPEDLQLARIVPIYPLTEGLRPRKLRDTIRQALDYWADRVPDYIPEATLERSDLADLGWALRNLHFPESMDHLAHAKRRYIFDQLLMLQLAVLANRRAWQATPSYELNVSEDWQNAFINAVFPYPLTGAQQRAIADIRADIAKPLPMNRLLQGDVGSGKTAVAIAALAMTFAAGKQSVLMAPTSILAEQHFRNVSAALAKLPEDHRPTVALLTGSLTASEREQVYSGLADGSIHILIGTHAVIQQGVAFADLALAIIDEQHRFGVEQRGALRSKGHNPHLLVMTATPIPRTLALTIHADLDLSVMDEMPPGRLPVKTKVIEPTGRERAYEFIQGQLDLGRQAFIVYPLVEASDKIEAQAATEAFEQLKPVFFKHRVGLLHGRMKPAEKDAIMADFSNHRFDVMVTTSVAEVGVDIPNASIILIDGANRFGLAQLHQFRGRVGRGGHPSYCLLVCDSDVEEARERLTALEHFNDGFRLAEIDWQMRGAGDLIGTRQSGQSSLQLMEDMSPELVELAQREAKTIFAEDPELSQEVHRLLAQRVAMLRDERSDIS